MGFGADSRYQARHGFAKQIQNHEEAQMPTRKAGESKADYLKRCIPVVKKEGASQKQAVGKCMGMARSNTKKGGKK